MASIVPGALVLSHLMLFQASCTMDYFLCFMGQEIEAQGNEQLASAEVLESGFGFQPVGLRGLCSFHDPPSLAPPTVPAHPSSSPSIAQQLRCEHTGWLPRRPLIDNMKGK